MGRGGPFNTNFHVTKTGFPKNRVSGWQGFEAPGPAYWCQYGYAICKVDVRGIAHSHGDMVFMGRQEGMDVYETIVNRGLVQKYRLSNPIAPGHLAEFLMDNTGNPISANNISDPKHFRESMGHSCRSTTLSTQHQNNSNAIQRARISKGLTQKTLAGRCGCSDDTARVRESGARTASVETLSILPECLEDPWFIGVYLREQTAAPSGFISNPRDLIAVPHCDQHIVAALIFRGVALIPCLSTF